MIYVHVQHLCVWIKKGETFNEKRGEEIERRERKHD